MFELNRIQLRGYEIEAIFFLSDEMGIELF